MTPSESTGMRHDGALGRFRKLLASSLEQGTFNKLVLGKYRGVEPDLMRISVRQVMVRDQSQLCCVYTYKTRDITKVVPLDQGLRILQALIEQSFGHAHLFTAKEEIQLLVSKKGMASLRSTQVSHAESIPLEHDREKHRFLSLDIPFLAALGVTNHQGQLIPAMARKWKQINKFIEVVGHAIETSGLLHAPQLDVVDFGSGKGYLTFALHHYLRLGLGLQAQVTGVELRADMVGLCEQAARHLELEGLRFEQGDVRTFTPPAIDIMIALHACDVATDYALHLGIRAHASIIVCSPCCHKQIRPQMHSPDLLRPMLRHGIHLGQEAEMVTDSLRALLLEAEGYAAQVFEFVSLEHTSKNKMILAVRRDQPVPQEELRAQIKGIKDFYGIQEHCLESLLQADR